MNTRFWVAWFPLSFNQSIDWKKREKIFPWLKELGLDALELQMTYGPRTKKETCSLYKQLATDFWIKLSVHSAYYIVLTSSEKAKIDQSIDTLQRTFELAHILWAKEIILHPGPLYWKEEDIIKNIFIENLTTCMKYIGETDIGLYIESAWKVWQLWSTQDILEISSLIDWVHPCLDFGHIHARTLWTLENIKNVQLLKQDILHFLHRFPEKNIHFHYTPIHYWPRWEIQHRAIDDVYPEIEQISLFENTNQWEKFFHPRPNVIAELLSEIPRSFTVISETHNSQEIWAQTLKKLFWMK